MKRTLAAQDLFTFQLREVECVPLIFSGTLLKLEAQKKLASPVNLSEIVHHDSRNLAQKMYSPNTSTRNRLLL